MTLAVAPRPLPGRLPPIGHRRRRARIASCALLAALWQTPLLAQGDAVDIDAAARAAEAGRAAAPAIVASETLRFAFGARALDARDGPALDALAERLAEDGSLRVLITAHTDSVGWALGNMELSRLRARAVARELVGRGVDVARVTARAYGESMAAASNATAAGRARNRRAEVSLLR